jgi:hypothetical protein
MFKVATEQTLEAVLESSEMVVTLSEKMCEGSY